MAAPRFGLRSYLQRSPAAIRNGYAMATAFVVYFCMYAFRKPFSAGTYEDLTFFATKVDLKTAFVISQIVGYALSKYIGIKICPEVTRRNRPWLLASLVLAAELALVLFALAPTNLKFVAIFLNGLPLGMVWGLVVWYLEGRQSSELLLAALSCSFIVSSGVVKDIGRFLLVGTTDAEAALQIPAVEEFWMPAATGLLFLLPFLLSVWMLNQIPEPSESDRAARSPRETMSVEQRIAFVLRYLPGLAMLIAAYVILTAFRDFRDNYTVDVLIELGLQEQETAISQMETVIAFIVMATMAALFLVKDNRRAVFGTLCIVGGGMLLVGIATALHRNGAIGGYAWLLAIGLGSYLAYVPYNSVLFDRLMASTRAAGTAVFAIYIADALGYTGSVAIQLFNDLYAVELTHLSFLEELSYFLSVVGGVLVLAGGVYFLRQPTEEPAPQVDASATAFSTEAAPQS